MVKKIYRINVLGAGMYGVLLAANLINNKEIKEKEIQVNLFDKANTILSTMKRKIINGYSINNGFYGIEMPRAEKTAEILKSLVQEKILYKKNYLRLININGDLIKFMSTINSWPKSITEDIKKIFDLERIKNISSEDLSQQAFSKINYYQLGGIIKKASYRYNDNFKDTWTQFYPWFFPGEFSFPNITDEGSKFYENYKRDLFIPYFYAPKSFIIDDLIHPIQNSLKKKGVNLNLNYEFSIDNIKSQKKYEEINIWSTSSFNLLNSASNSFAKSLLLSERFHHLLLFKMPYKSLNKILTKFGNMPSEILCLDQISLGSSRISFPENSKLLEKNNFQLVLLEFYTLKKEITNCEILSANKLINQLFNCDAKFISKEFGRKVYSIDYTKIPKAKNIIRNLSRDKNIIVPKIFWGPINIAKCGLYAEEATNKIIDYLY